MRTFMRPSSAYLTLNKSKNVPNFDQKANKHISSVHESRNNKQVETFCSTHSFLLSSELNYHLNENFSRN